MFSVEQNNNQFTNSKVLATIREERIIVKSILAETETAINNTDLHNSSSGENVLGGRIEESVYAGNDYILYVECGGGIRLQTRVPKAKFISPPLPGMVVSLVLPKKDVRIINDD